MTPREVVDLAKEYLALRRGLGFDLEGPGQLLLDFGQYVDGTDHDGPLTTDIAVQWALATGSGGTNAPARRLSAVRQFARYRATFDPGTEVRPRGSWTAVRVGEAPTSTARRRSPRS